MGDEFFFGLTVKDKRNQRKFEELARDISQEGTNQIFGLAEDEASFKRHKRLLRSEAFDVETVNTHLLQRAASKTKRLRKVFVPLDGSEIRKPRTTQVKALMLVKSQAGSLVNGYRTMNAVAVTPEGEHCYLLETKIFSSQGLSQNEPEGSFLVRRTEVVFPSFHSC